MGARNNTLVFPFFSGSVEITFILHSIFFYLFVQSMLNGRKLKPIAPLYTVCIGINKLRDLPTSVYVCLSFALAPVFILNFSFACRVSPRGGDRATANPANRFYANITLFLFPASIWRETPRRPFNVHFLMIVRSERLLEIRECATPSTPPPPYTLRRALCSAVARVSP